MVDIVQCPYCDLIWTPRKENPRWCPRCKRWIFKSLKPVTTLEDRWSGKNRPLYKEEGEVINVDPAMPCSLCGEYHMRLIQIKDMRLCKNCIYKLLDEDPVPWQV